MDIQGETFSRVFGTNTALFEQFVLCRNVMGPCWLNIQNANFSSVQGVCAFSVYNREMIVADLTYSRCHGVNLKRKLINYKMS
jgi:hypothetical protein